MRVMLVEGNTDHADLIKNMFRKIGVENIQHFGTLQSGLERLEEHEPDIFFSSLQLPDSNIKNTVSTLRGLKSDTPIVILTSLSSHQTAANMLSGGIQDYLSKDDITHTLLQRVCRHAIQRKKNQVQLEKRNDELEAFCEYLVHEFKTPIKRVAEQTQSLRDEIRRDTFSIDAVNKCLESTCRNTELSLSLVDNLYAYLSIDYEDVKFEKIDTNEIFSDIDVVISFKRDTDYTLEVAANLPELYGSRSLLTLLFANVINNGIKFNKRHPVIKVQGSKTAEENLSTITISDNGIGIAPAFIDEIFRPFSRLHEREFAGSGLGLSIVRRIVDCHDSSISVDSFVDTGSSFTFHFHENSEQ